MRERLRLIRKILKLSQTEFGNLLNKKLRTVQAWEYGEINIDDGVLLRLHEVFSVNIDWMRTGIGEMFNKPVVAKNTLAIKSQPVRHGADRAVGIRYFPEVKAAAGYGAFVNDETSEEYWVDYTAVRSKNFDVVINVLGDSMSPTLMNGDKILVNTNVDNFMHLIEGFIYVVRTGDTIVIKRYISHEGYTCIFKSDNKRFKDIRVDFTDEANGVVGVLRRIVDRRIQPDIEDALGTIK